jgi:hypothetical protein
MMCFAPEAEEMAVKKELAEEIQNAVRRAFDEHANAKLTRFKSWSPLAGRV